MKIDVIVIYLAFLGLCLQVCFQPGEVLETAFQLCPHVTLANYHMH